jgi:large subunit ribosomal protein L22
MGRAFRYQRRLTHIVLSVAERNSGTSLVTKVEEPKAAKATKGKSVAAKAAAAKTAAALKAEAKKAPAKKAAKTVVKKASKKA